MKAYAFIKNALILTAVSFVLRGIGIVFKVYLAGKIGAEGIGLYQLVFSCYVFATTFASSGICTAVTRLVSENPRGGKASEKRIMSRAALCTAVMSAVWMSLMFFGAETVAVFFIKDVRVVPAIRILSFAIPSVGFCSCLRGYFIAKSRVGLNSASQIAEQAVRIITVVLLVGNTADKGLSYTCAAVMLGDTLAEAVSCIIMYIGYRIELKKAPNGKPIRGVLKETVRIALPITAGKYLTTGLHTAENLLVPRGLQKTSSRKESIALFGKLKGMALPLIFFPASFLGALSTLMIPEMARAAAVGDRKKQISATEKIFGRTLIASILIGGIFAVYPQKIAAVVYGDSGVGDIIARLVPIIPFMYVESVADGMLKGLDQQVRSFYYNLADSSLRVLAVLIIVPKYGMNGFLMIMTVSNIVTSSLHSARLFKTTGTPFNFFGWVIKPLVFTALGGFSGYFLSRAIKNSLVAVTVEAVVHTAVFAAGECIFSRNEILQKTE